jgi:hypothetical protein
MRPAAGFWRKARSIDNSRAVPAAFRKLLGAIEAALLIASDRRECAAAGLPLAYVLRAGARRLRSMVA